ncbi:MAG: CehA/McbA family metallohydrolase [Bacillota bacterium]
MFTYPGNIHIHSRCSDGSGTVSEVAAAAAATGLKYVVITDHETLAALPEEGYSSGVAVLVGVELNRNRNHYLALGLPEMIPGNEEYPQEMIDRVQAKGALGFIAHPFEQGSPLIQHGKAYPWTDWPVYRFTGMEIWNYSSHWRGRATSLLRTLYWFLFNRKAALDGPPVEALRIWDCYTGSGQRVVGIGGTDAHAIRQRFGFVATEIFPYLFLFRAINTYICLRKPLSLNFREAKHQIYTALAGGNCFISFDQLFPGAGFTCYTRCRSSREPAAIMGEEIAFRKDMIIDIKCPTERSLMRIIHQGRLIARAPGPQMCFNPPSAGVYRVEVYFRPLRGRPRPWIYANPIYFK